MSAQVSAGFWVRGDQTRQDAKLVLSIEAREGIEDAFVRVVRRRLPGRRVVALRDDPHSVLEAPAALRHDDGLEAAA